MFPHPAIPAVEALARAAKSRPLIDAVGPEHAAALEARAVETRAALQFRITEGFEGDENLTLLAAQGKENALGALHALYSLALHCISLTSLVSSDFDDGAAASASLEDIDWGGYFGIAVAEAVAIGLSAVAAGLDADTSARAIEMLESLSVDLDGFFMARLYGELCRLQIQETAEGNGDASTRLLRALRAICAWTLAALGRAVGYHRFSGAVLKEWASGDSLWVLILSKGVLSIPADAASAMDWTGHESGVCIPEELANLQHTVINAVFQLASPVVLLSSEAGGDDVAITVWNTQLVAKRAELSEAVCSCQLIEFLIRAAAAHGPAAVHGLATFMVTLIQGELCLPDSQACQGISEHVLWEARNSSTVLVQRLKRYADLLWQALMDVPGCFGEFLPAQFIHDCADLSYSVPHSDQGVAFTEKCFATLGDPAAIVALCVLAANSGRIPHAGLLEDTIRALGQPQRELVLERMGAWRGPVHASSWQHWVSLLVSGIQLSWDDLPPQRELLSETATPVAPKLSTQGILSDLVRDAPPEYRCPLDGQLMLDPVRTPQGYIFERSSLASAISSINCCPISGQPLALAVCTRDGNLRKEISMWVRQRQSLRSRQ